MKTLQKLLSPILIATVCMSALASAADGNELDARPVISIWPAGTAGVDPSVAEEFHKQKSIYVKTIHNPTLTVFRPENPNGVAVVICPGGGYTFLSFENEGKRIAEKLNKSGITAFVLKYRLPTTQGADFKHPVPLSDALRAIQWIRGHATEYKLDPKRIGIMGFSAGGHLAASAGTLYSKYSFGTDEISKVSSRPDFMCLGYPVISTQKEFQHGCVRSPLKAGYTPAQLKEMSCELNVNAQTPPTFLMHAKNDKGVLPQNSIVMHEALKKQGVATELKLYEQGGHGFGLGRTGTDSTQWMGDFIDWLPHARAQQGRVWTPEEIGKGAFSQRPDKALVYKTVDNKGEATELKLQVFLPKGHQASDSRPAAVFFHGGGWRGGTPDHMYPQCRYLALRGMVAISVQYRTINVFGTTPKECVKDGKSAMRWVRTHAAELGIDPSRIVAGGGSAGGHIAAATALVEAFDEAGEDASVSCRPEALVLFNPVFDNGPQGFRNSLVREYWKAISPIDHIDANTPPTFVILGTKDKHIPVETAKRFERLMTEQGRRCDLHLYEGRKHGFYNIWEDRNALADTMIRMDRFLSSLGYLEGEPALALVSATDRNHAQGL